MLVMKRFLPLGGLLLLNCRGRRVKGQVSWLNRNTLQSLGLGNITGYDESLGRNTATALDGVAMLNVPRLLRTQLQFLPTVQSDLQASAASTIIV